MGGLDLGVARGGRLLDGVADGLLRLGGELGVQLCPSVRVVPAGRATGLGTSEGFNPSEVESIPLNLAPRAERVTTAT
ncbi:hypothetical protein Cde04nite_01190 [Cellulomonas denverensis]|nr:hypothetical protein Cde04nite_01190 [Cellulomonas denverensis]